MDIDLVVRNILLEFLKKDGNLYHSEKIFIAHTILIWVFENFKDENQIAYYISQVKRFLRGEIIMYWKDGKVRIMNRS